MADVIVGRFALIDLIAKGGSGSVWRAWDSKAGELCAAKVLRQRDSADLMRFVREKGVSFDHPHLLTPYGWGAEDEHVVIAMPLAAGGTLDSVVRTRGGLAEPAVVVLLDQLLDGLSHVHAEGWIHRDVKPANIMFEPHGRAAPVSRLADFGIAVHESDVRFTHVGMVNGTPGYMAPELFAMAEPHPSHDLYAAGVVALVALNGRIRLHDGAFRPDELAQHLRGVTPKLSAVIRTLLAAQPEERYQDADTVRRDLPRVPPGYPLTHADGAPLDLVDTLDPLPPDAPGAVRPERPVPELAPSSMEAIRAGQVQQGFSSGSPSPQTGPRGHGPQQGAPGQYGGGPGLTPPSRSSPQTTTSAQAPVGPVAARPAGTHRSTLIAAGIGIAAAVLLGAIVAVTLLWVFPRPGSALPGTEGTSHSSIDPSFAEVEAGQECAPTDEGVIALTPDGAYVSCTAADDGAVHRFA